MTTTNHTSTTPNANGLFVACELALDKWLLAFATQPAQKPRFRSIPARDIPRLLEEISKAKKRFGLPEQAPVFTCYEAGRDGFWLHRCLGQHRIHNIIVDSASIQVDRRARRRKDDGIDAGQLVSLLLRYHHGERKVCSVINVPAPRDEDRRHLHRGLKELQQQRTECSNRIKGLLFSQGIDAKVDKNFAERLGQLRDWEGKAVPAGMQQRLLQEFAVWQTVHEQIQQLEEQQLQQLDKGKGAHLQQMRLLLRLKGIGKRTAWVLVLELFSWRQIRNGKELGALVGLAPVPYRSGQSDREQGLSKAGNRQVRSLMVELAWLWRRYQPHSQLSQWYEKRFAKGNRRARKSGICALARKLLIALWRWACKGEWPEGAVEKDWREALR